MERCVIPALWGVCRPHFMSLEHLGLMEPQDCQEPNEPVTSFMRPAPVYNMDETNLEEDRAVADPLSDQALGLWQDTARRNREIFTELFRPVPTNLVRNKESYKVRYNFPKHHHFPSGVDTGIVLSQNYLPNVKTGHLIPDVPLARVKDRLSQVRGHLVECPLDFLIDDKEFVEGPDWIGLNPTLPIYI